MSNLFDGPVLVHSLQPITASCGGQAQGETTGRVRTQSSCVNNPWQWRRGILRWCQLEWQLRCSWFWRGAFRKHWLCMVQVDGIQLMRHTMEAGMRAAQWVRYLSCDKMCLSLTSGAARCRCNCLNKQHMSSHVGDRDGLDVATFCVNRCTSSIRMLSHYWTHLLKLVIV